MRWFEGLAVVVYLAIVMLARELWLMPLVQPALAVIAAFVATWAYRGMRRL